MMIFDIFIFKVEILRSKKHNTVMTSRLLEKISLKLKNY